MASYEIPVPGTLTLRPVHLPVGGERILSFVADSGMIEVTTFGVEFPNNSLSARRQGGDDGPPDPSLPQDVRIEVSLAPPGGGFLSIRKVFKFTNIFSDHPSEPLTYNVHGSQAGGTWRCRFKNVGKHEITCFGTIDYIASHVQSPIAWLPNALAPVFWGFQDVSPIASQATEVLSRIEPLATGSPTPVRILFPTLDGSPQNARPLQIERQYPLIVLCHGNCQGDPAHYLDWAGSVIAIQLARAGYVVAVPHLPGITGTVPPVESDRDFDLVQDVVTWMYAQWAHADILAPNQNKAIFGHSWGALLAGRLAANGGFRAYISMSGEWADWFNSLGSVLPEITVPGFYIWGANAGLDVAPLPSLQWNDLIHEPKHKALVDGMSHFDYLPPGVTPCNPGRGPCVHAREMIADIVTMFMAKYAPPPTLPALPGRIPVTLVPPRLALTAEQEFYAGGYLNGFALFAGDPAPCQLTLSYETSAGSGSITEP